MCLNNPKIIPKSDRCPRFFFKTLKQRKYSGKKTGKFNLTSIRSKIKNHPYILGQKEFAIGKKNRIHSKYKLHGEIIHGWEFAPSIRTPFWVDENCILSIFHGTPVVVSSSSHLNELGCRSATPVLFFLLDTNTIHIHYDYFNKALLALTPKNKFSRYINENTGVYIWKFVNGRYVLCRKFNTFAEAKEKAKQI